MEIIKHHSAYYCNVKFLLIMLVVFGHAIEPAIERSPVVMTVYKLIYCVHMPLFAFVSGIFMKTVRTCVKQALKAFKWYAVAQGVYIVVCVLTGENCEIFTPYWHTWYLLSLGCWSLLACAVIRLAKGAAARAAIFAAAAAAACLCVNIGAVGRMFSLSRTIVFFPYVLAGIWTRQDFFVKKRKLAPAAALVCFAGWKSAGPVNGVLLRLGCMAMAFSFGYAILSVVPKRKNMFSKIGDNTMPVYLLHGPMLKILPLTLKMNWSLLLLSASAVSAVLVIVIYELFRWYNPISAIE